MILNNSKLKYFSETLLEKRKNHHCILPVRNEAQKFADEVIQLLFPHFSPQIYYSSEEIEGKLQLLKRNLKSILLSLDKNTAFGVEKIANEFGEILLEVHNKLWLDAEAIYKGDPAAESIDEVILAYPGFYAIAVYRIANIFYRLEVPIFPRILTEYAHQLTGIDIHPGATIGDSFCIDHGTGIVIGETTIIGNRVKIYQGVTLGALSVDKKLADVKRHPTIEDDVVIYSQAVILGGNTIIGKNSIIGGNVWLTESVPAYSVVYHKSEVRFRSNENGLNGEIINFVI